MKDYDKEIEELKARRREVGLKLGIKKEGAPRRKLVREAMELDRKVTWLETEQQKEIERLEIEQQEKLSARVTPAEISRVQVFRRYRMVRVYGVTKSRIQPHLDHMKHYLDEFKILSIQPSLTGEKRLEAHSYMLTFGGDEGLDKYLEFNGWQDLPDESRT